MKFVRWLGAFGAGSSLTEAAEWEQSQTARQVAAEPLYRGRSLLPHAKIGLEIAHPEATFRRGWLADAWTHERADGTLRATRARKVEFKDLNRFLAAWSRYDPVAHGEAAFAAPLYCAVVVKKDATPRAKRRAARLAAQLNLEVKIL